MYIFYFIFGLISMGTLIAAIQNKVATPPSPSWKAKRGTGAHRSSQGRRG